MEGADNYTALSIIVVQSPHSLPKKGEKSALGLGMRRKSRMAPEFRAKIRLGGAVGCVWAVMRRPKAGLAMDGAATAASARPYMISLLKKPRVWVLGSKV